MPRFSVTYDIVTPESAEHGDTAENGFISSRVRLRDAVADFLRGRTRHRDSGNGVEDQGDWFANYHGMEFKTGAYETRYLFPPHNVTPASYARLARLLGIRK